MNRPPVTIPYRPDPPKLRPVWWVRRRGYVVGLLVGLGTGVFFGGLGGLLWGTRPVAGRTTATPIVSAAALHVPVAADDHGHGPVVWCWIHRSWKEGPDPLGPDVQRFALWGHRDGDYNLYDGKVIDLDRSEAELLAKAKRLGCELRTPE